MISDLNRSLRSWYLASVIRMKRMNECMHRERAHLKVPGCSLVLSALLTKKDSTSLRIILE